MDYGKIVSTGWKQAWQHKTLWIFGLLISGGGLSYVNDIGNKFKLGRHFNFSMPDIDSYLADNIGLVFLLLAVAFVAFIIWVILATISEGGLIDAAGQLKRGEEYSFGRAFKSGAHYFWRIFGLGLLIFVVIFALIIIIVLFGIVAFKLSTGLGILTAIILIPIALVGSFIVGMTLPMAQRYIVLQDRMVFDSISDGFNLWKSHLGPALLYALIYIGIGIVVVMGTLLVIFVVVTPFVAVAFINLILALLVGIPVVLLVLLVVNGFSGSALNLMTTEFYYQLLDEGKLAAVPPLPDAGLTPPSVPPQPPTPQPPTTPPIPPTPQPPTDPPPPSSPENF